MVAALVKEAVLDLPSRAMGGEKPDRLQSRVLLMRHSQPPDQLATFGCRICGIEMYAFGLIRDFFFLVSELVRHSRGKGAEALVSWLEKKRVFTQISRCPFFVS